MSAQTMRKALVLFLASALLVAGCAAALGLFVYRYPDRRHGGDGRAVQLTVHKGEALPTLAGDLAGASIIAYPLLFRLYVSRAGKAGHLLPGTYALTTAMTPREVIDVLTTPLPERAVTVTIPEGKNILYVAETLGKAGIAPEAEVLAAERDPDVARELGVPAPTLEGYLFPDTYQLKPNTPAVKALAVLVKHHKEVWGQIAAQHAAEIAAIESSLVTPLPDGSKTRPFTERDILTMASIVEKETANPVERPRVAAVYLNRLRLPSFQPKRLEADPTILYGCTALTRLSAACQEYQKNAAEEHDERIHTAQLRDKDNPYNTYTHYGVPPGPICNPGRASILAVLEPENDDYVYFVARNDGSGTHYFSATEAQHRRAVDYFQKGIGTEPAPVPPLPAPATGSASLAQTAAAGAHRHHHGEQH